MENDYISEFSRRRSRERFINRKAKRPLTTCLSAAAFLNVWCSERESNSHGLPHTPLKRARLPVPPSELEKNSSLLRGRSGRRSLGLRGRGRRRRFGFRRSFCLRAWRSRRTRRNRRAWRSLRSRRRERSRVRRRRRRRRPAFIDYRFRSDARNRKHQRQEHKEQRRHHGRLFKRLLRAARAESRLAARSAESRRHVASLSRLQKNNQDQKGANQNENYLKKEEQG